MSWPTSAAGRGLHDLIPQRLRNCQQRPPPSRGRYLLGDVQFPHNAFLASQYRLITIIILQRLTPRTESVIHAQAARGHHVVIPACPIQHEERLHRKGARDPVPNTLLSKQSRARYVNREAWLVTGRTSGQEDA